MANPTVQRRQLGVALKKAREQAGMKQEEAGKVIDAAGSKISRIELGQSGMRLIDLNALITAYRVSDAVAESLRDLARTGRQRGRWSTYREQLPTWFRTFVDLEGEASEIRSYQAELVPGTLQTEDYIRVVLAGTRSPDEETLNQQVDIRLQRQSVLDSGTELAYVLSESVLRRVVGGPEVMRRQLAHLVELCRRPNVTIQVLPFAAQTFADPSYGFVILRFDEDSASDVIYTEAYTDADYLDRPDLVRAYNRLWDDLRAAALGPVESRLMIEQLGGTY